MNILLKTKNTFFLLSSILLCIGTIAHANSSQIIDKKSYSFPKYDPKAFALSKNGDNLDPSKAYPNINEYGLKTLTIQSTNEFASIASFNKIATTVPVPHGWHSRGGWDPFNKVFITKEKYKDDTPPMPNIALKVLVSQGLKTILFDEVQTKVIGMMSDPSSKSKLIKYTNKSSHYFILESEYTRNDQKKVKQLDIYIQDPTPKSSLWLNIQMACSPSDFEKYKPLMGHIFAEYKMDWKELQRVISAFQ